MIKILHSIFFIILELIHLKSLSPIKSFNLIFIILSILQKGQAFKLKVKIIPLMPLLKSLTFLSLMKKYIFYQLRNLNLKLELLL